jgi:hypothetical protein
MDYMDTTIIRHSVTLFEIVCVIVVFAFLFVKSRFFTEVYEHRAPWTTRVLLMVFFGILSITGISIAETGTPGSGARFVIQVPEGMYRFRTDGSPGAIQ